MILLRRSIVAAAFPFAASVGSAALDTAKIDTLTGLKGTWNEAEKVHKASQPRNDLPIAVDGWTMPPFMGLTSWAAFTQAVKSEVMLAGDLVLFEDEVNPVMSAALDAGLSITALHNHFFFDQPRAYFMHIGGEGTTEQMAKGVRAAFAKQKKSAPHSHSMRKGRLRADPPAPENPMKPLNARLCLSMCATLATAQTQRVSFDDVAASASPAGWMLTKTGKGSPVWRVEADTSAPSKPHALKQSGEATYPLALFEASNLRDGFVEVKFKSVSGREDQAGGVAWRARDADNYYVCRANALENNVVLYKTEKGKRSSLDIIGRSGGYGTKAEVAKNQWHTLRVEFAGKRFKVIFNSKPLFEVEDSTFAEGGKVGLWTKADSVTLFDDFAFGPQ